MVCVGCGGDGGDGGEELAGLKKLMKGKKCNQCKTTNKKSGATQPSGCRKAEMSKYGLHVLPMCPLQIIAFTFSPLFVNQVCVFSGRGVVYAFIFPFLFIHYHVSHVLLLQLFQSCLP